MTPIAKSVIILSAKSSGSSALQEFLCRFGGGRHISCTRHSEFESLYWTKAASVLELPQVRLPDSEVPIDKARAARDLNALLADNAPTFMPPADSIELVFRGWHALCVAHSPTFVEKSPHHLHQQSCLDLMVQAIERLPDIDFRLVGLVRNPMDVLYSAWSRWRTPPELNERHWTLAYENLERLQASLPRSSLVTVRYEDLASDASTADRLLASLGLQASGDGVADFFHGGSRLKWLSDTTYGFQLAPRTIALAERFGYAPSELMNKPNVVWPIRRSAARLWHQALVFARRRMRTLSRSGGGPR